MLQSRAVPEPQVRVSHPHPHPAPPLQLGLVGRDAPPADADCSAGSASAAAVSAAPLAPGSLPEMRGPPGTYGAPPPPSARFPRGPWSFRTCESGRSAAQKMDAGGWARTPVPPPVQAGGRPDLERTHRPQGRCGRRGSSPPVPPLQSWLGQGHRAGPGHRGAGLAHPGPVRF